MGEKVSKIAIAGFRGATSPVEIILDPSKSVTLIFGENGTGKSTIADAIDFVCNRSFGSLENYSLGGPASKYIAALGCATSNLKVTLVAGSKTWLATLSKDGVTVIPSTDCPDARVLRRKTILNLIEAQPRQRFEALRVFITVPNVERSEDALRETVKATEDSFNEAVRSLTHAEDELEKLWTTESKPGTSAIDWATTEAQKDLSELRGNVDQVARLEPAFHSVETALNTLTRALAERKTATESLAAAQTKQNVADSSQTQQNAQLLGLLQDAQTYVTQNKTLSRCPICEQGVDSSELVKRLGERIAAMRELAELVSATGTAKRQLDTKISVSDHARTEFYQRATILADVLKSSLLNDIKAFALEWINFCGLLSEETLSETVEQEARRLWPVASQCRQSLQARREIDQKSLNQHNAIKGHDETLKKRKMQAGSDETLLKKLKAALNLVSQQRKNTWMEYCAPSP